MNRAEPTVSRRALSSLKRNVVPSNGPFTSASEGSRVMLCIGEASHVFT